MTELEAATLRKLVKEWMGRDFPGREYSIGDITESVDDSGFRRTIYVNIIPTIHEISVICTVCKTENGIEVEQCKNSL